MIHKKPEKKTVPDTYGAKGNQNQGYNQACDDWEKYHNWIVESLRIQHQSVVKDMRGQSIKCDCNLPSEEEISKIVARVIVEQDGCYDNREIAKAIARRIGVINDT